MDTTKDVIQIISDRLGQPVKNITLEADIFADLNASRIELADIIQTLEEKFGVKFEIEHVKEFHMVSDIINYLNENVD